MANKKEKFISFLSPVYTFWAFYLFYSEKAVSLPLQKSCNIKYVMAYKTKQQAISESFHLSRV